MENAVSQPVIELLNLSAGYPGKTLFSDLHLTMTAGELICFMGPNGVGKSTLMRTIAGLQKPLNGTIVFHGNSLLRERLVSLVLTDPIRAGYMTVEDLVEFGRYPYLDWRMKLTSRDVELIDFAFDEVNIRHLRHRNLNELSDGQKQMVMIARALAQDTPIILLDEPTAHLDLNNRVEIMRLLKRLTRSMNKTILLATHELDLALQMADVIWLAGEQQKIIKGIPEDLVLRGAFDSIFQFKGFDLRTGKIQHEIFRRTSIRLEGRGHPYLWTRNLLERNGFQISADGSVHIVIEEAVGEIAWTSEGQRFVSLSDLLHSVLRRSTE